MTTNLQDITLESMDGTLVAKNENGHLTYAMLHLDREPVPSDAQDFEQVLVFVDGKVRVSGGDNISPTVIVLFDGNGFSQTLDINTGGAWSASGVNSPVQVDKMSGTGIAQLTITKASTFSEPGVHSSTFTVTLDGAEQPETTIQVYIVIEGEGGCDHEDFDVFTIDLDEDNGYKQPLNIPAAGSWNIVGINSPIQVSKASGTGNIDIIVESTNKTTPQKYPVNVFVVTNGSDEIIAVVVVNITVTMPLKVEYGSQNLSTRDSAVHGETLEIILKESNNYAAEKLFIIREQQWNITNVDINKLTMSPLNGQGQKKPSPSYYDPDYGIMLTTFQKASSFIPSGFESTEFWVVSRNQSVKVVVHFAPQITGEFVNPPDGKGTPGTNDPVYIFI